MALSEQWVFGRRAAISFLADDANHEILEAVLSDALPRDLRRQVESRRPGQAVLSLPKKEMDRRFPGVRHQGIALRVRLPAGGAAGSDWRNLAEERSGLIVVLDRMQDVHNVGAIVRSAEALGAAALILTGKGASMNPTVHRIAAGATAYLPVFQESNLNQTLRSLKELGRWICASASAADLAEDGDDADARLVNHQELSALPAAEELVLVIGNEGEGVKALALRDCDFILSITLPGKTGSLNASVAAGILIDRLIHRR